MLLIPTDPLQVVFSDQQVMLCMEATVTVCVKQL